MVMHISDETQASNTKLTALFVDDDERILRSLHMLFRNELNVITATSGHEAIEHIQCTPVHVVVSDQRMPGMMGIELLRNVKAISPNTIRILLTGYSELTAIVGSVNDGEIFRFINKPWDPQEIRKTVRKAAEIAKQLERTHYLNTHPLQNLEPNVNKLGVLVIDNDETTLDMVRKIVEPDHFVVWGNSLDQAFELLTCHNIGIVVSELKLNGHDTSAAIKMLKRYKPGILTVITTSFQDTTTLIELINEGQVYRVLPKPLRQGLLEISLQSTLRQHRLVDRTPQLVRRYQVETPHNKALSVSTRIMGYLRKIQQHTQNPSAVA
ncbi:MAG TPA: response regulator [Acidiferrobacteraceae bacterium]|nr:response regulator [Acidiferrobacteraceae bacterium]